MEPGTKDGGAAGRVLRLCALVSFLVVCGTPFPLLGQGIDASQLFKEYAPAVVTVVAKNGQGQTSQGSGVLVSSDGIVASALHVVRGADKAVVKLANGDAYDSVTVLAYDQRRDLVLLKVPGFDLRCVPLGNSNKVAVGEQVVVISSPEGLGQSVATGVVSAVREVSGWGYSVIQTSAPASAGSSGGALLDSEGHLIGIISFKVVGGENLNFGVPVNYVRGMMENRSSLSLTQLSRRLEEPNPQAAAGGGPIHAPASESWGSDLSGLWVSYSEPWQRWTLRVRLDPDGQHAYVEDVSHSYGNTFYGDRLTCKLARGIIVKPPPKGTANAEISGWRKVGERYVGTCSGLLLDPPGRFHWRIEIGTFSPLKLAGRLYNDWTSRQEPPPFFRAWEPFTWLRPEPEVGR